METLLQGFTLLLQGFAIVLVVYAIYLMVTTTIEVNNMEKKYDHAFDSAIQRARNIKFKSSTGLKLDLQKWND